VTTAETAGLKRAAVRWSRVAYSSKAPATTCGSLAVSAGALEMYCYLRRLRSVLAGFTFTFTFYLLRSLKWDCAVKCTDLVTFWYTTRDVQSTQIPYFQVMKFMQCCYYSGMLSLHVLYKGNMLLKATNTAYKAKMVIAITIVICNS